MASLEKAQRTTQGWAARNGSGTLSPYSYVLRSTGPEDVLVKVICCGICHSDVGMVKNKFGISNYPMVPGHEVVGTVEEVGSEVTKVNVGDYVGVGFIVGSCGDCNLCVSDNEHYCEQHIWIFNHKCTDGKLTHGGFAAAIVVPQRFVVQIPNGMAPEQVAPLLCGGITAYSPLVRHGLNRSGLRGGILGLGGIGHLGVMLAKAMGHHVTVISSSDKKREEALKVLGADVFLVSSDPNSTGEAAASLDYIIDTLPVFHHLETCMNLLKVGGKLILVGSPNVPLQFSTAALHFKAITIAGSFIGSVKETEELIKFFYEKGLTSKIEVIKMDYVNTAFERLEKNDVRYKFVIDVAGSNLDS